jgi:hypothetical protein
MYQRKDKKKEKEKEKKNALESPTKKNHIKNLFQPYSITPKPFFPFKSVY